MFNFYVSAENHHEHLLSYLNKGEMKQTFLNRKYKQILNILPTRVNRSTYHVFTLPFQFVKLMLIGSELPDIKFDCVTELSIEEVVPFQNKFFVRISKCFPMLKHFSVSNSSSILSNQTTADENISRDSIIEYPHLISFDLFRTCTQIIDQFLNENKTHLPRLGHLTIQYEDLRNVTQDFTREATRYNCANVTKLTTYREMVGSKQFHLYFPLL